MTPAPNGLANFYSRTNYGIDLSPQFDWIFNGGTFELTKSSNGPGQTKLGFGSLVSHLQSTHNENQRLRFYAKLISRLALQDRKNELKDLFIVLDAQETSRGFTNHLVDRLEIEINRSRLTYPYHENAKKIYDVVEDVVRNGPNRNSQFYKAFAERLKPHLNR